MPVNIFNKLEPIWNILKWIFIYLLRHYETITDFFQYNWVVLLFGVVCSNTLCYMVGLPVILPALWFKQIVCFILLPRCLMLHVDVANNGFEPFASALIIFVFLPTACGLLWFFVDGLKLLKEPGGYLLISWWQIPVSIIWNWYMFVVHQIYCHYILDRFF